MKTGLNDKILDRMSGLQEMTTRRIAKKLEGEKPVNSDKIPPERLIWAVNALGSEDFVELLNEFGTEAMSKLRWEVYKLEQRRM